MSFIDMHSDNIVEPSEEMKKRMFTAKSIHTELEDYTVSKLIRLACDLLDKEDGIFIPSGTMANEIAFLTHCYPRCRPSNHPMPSMTNFIESLKFKKRYP